MKIKKHTNIHISEVGTRELLALLLKTDLKGLSVIKMVAD